MGRPSLLVGSAAVPDMCVCPLRCRGIFYDRMERHHRMGPRLTLLFGILANAVGYLGLWAALTGRIHASFGHIMLFAAVACSGGPFFDIGVAAGMRRASLHVHKAGAGSPTVWCAAMSAVGLATNVRNFTHHRGTVVGVLKASVGLSGALYTGWHARPSTGWRAATQPRLLRCVAHGLPHAPCEQLCCVIDGCVMPCPLQLSTPASSALQRTSCCSLHWPPRRRPWWPCVSSP